MTTLTHETDRTYATDRATCGHLDTLGAITGTVCERCAREGHAEVMGR